MYSSYAEDLTGEVEEGDAEIHHVNVEHAGSSTRAERGKAAESGDSVKSIEFVEYHGDVQPVESNLSDSVLEVEDSVEEVNASRRTGRRREQKALIKAIYISNEH